MASITEEEVIKVLNTVIEKQSGKSIYEMGLVTQIEVKDDNISIIVTPTDPSCPIGMKLAYDAKVALLNLPDVGKVNVKLIEHKHADEMNKMLKELG
ncbi:MAG: iron-sulfur cluster assembly protein [Thermoplasmata archaeon]|nr:iron-sulfur cluster assembly protein [Thermoplasmata archaeon]